MPPNACNSLCGTKWHLNGWTRWRFVTQAKRLNIKRRDCLKASAAAGAVAVCGPQLVVAHGETGGGNSMPKPTPPENPAELNLCLQWGPFPAVR